MELSSRAWSGFWTLAIGCLIAYAIWLNAGEHNAPDPVPTPSSSTQEK